MHEEGILALSGAPLPNLDIYILSILLHRLLLHVDFVKMDIYQNTIKHT